MASIRSLLVQLDDTPSSPARLRHAVALASRHGSALTAAFVADLLVIGCHGHGRLTELLLDGASRHVLLHCTVPLLMVH